jgi:hypothetical protein
MTLENLARIGKPRSHETNRTEAGKLLAAARRNLADARVKQVSSETRFDAAYKAAMQCALVALMANGFRPSSNEPGHHATLLQTLPKTLGLSDDTWIVLDKLRRIRNSSDYTGQEVSEQETAACVRAD